MAILATGVTKVSGKVADTSGEVVLTAADVGAAPSGYGLGTDGPQIADANITAPVNAFLSPSGASSVNFFERYSPMIQAFRAGGADGSGQMLQIQASNETIAFRMRGSNTWTGWVKCYTPFNKPTATDIQNVVSPVSAGGIIERGSNANGEYVKFADGTMICTTSVITDPVGSLGAGTLSDMYRTNTVSTYFPTSFVSASPTLSMTYEFTTGDTGDTAPFCARKLGDATLSNTGTIQLVGGVKTSISHTVSIIAIGRWK